MVMAFYWNITQMNDANLYNKIMLFYMDVCLGGH